MGPALGGSERALGSQPTTQATNHPTSQPPNQPSMEGAMPPLGAPLGDAWKVPCRPWGPHWGTHGRCHVAHSVFSATPQNLSPATGLIVPPIQQMASLLEFLHLARSRGHCLVFCPKMAPLLSNPEGCACDIDSEGIRAPAGRAQWISSPAP